MAQPFGWEPFGNDLKTIGNGFDRFWVTIKNGYTLFNCSGYFWQLFFQNNFW